MEDEEKSYRQNIAIAILGIMVAITLHDLFRGPTAIGVGNCGPLWTWVVLVCLLGGTAGGLCIFKHFYHWIKDHARFTFLLGCILYSLFPLALYNLVAKPVNWVVSGRCLSGPEPVQFILTILYIMFMLVLMFTLSLRKRK